MWSYLVVLVLAPLLATTGLGAAVVQLRLAEVRHLEVAEQLLRDSVRIDAVRRAVDQELLPTLILSVVRDESRARAAGLTGGLRTQLLTTNETALRAARSRTDSALAGAGTATTTATTSASATAVAARTSGRMDAVRADADADVVGPAMLTARYLDVSDTLVVAECDAAVRAGATGVDPRTAQAVDDVGFIVDLTGLASRQLPSSSPPWSRPARSASSCRRSGAPPPAPSTGSAARPPP